MNSNDRWAAGVNVVRGIRYARAERFQLPMLEPLHAERVTAPAPQPDAAGAEDCLHLTIWSPRGADALPVLVWIHGGAHIVGSAADPVTDGARLAGSQNVVVVAAQYRLGALGHLLVDSDDDSETDAGNAALHDQIAALHWVQRHIAAFGGDPGAVTLMGQSAGGVDVLALLVVTEGESLVHRVIAHSCTAERTLTADQALLVRDELLHAADLRSVRALRALSVDALVAAQTHVIERRQASAAIDSLPFRPVIDHRLLHQTPLQALRDGTASTIPLLIGANRREALPWMGDEPEVPGAVLALLEAVAPQARAHDLALAFERDRGRTPTARALREAVLSEVMYRSPIERVVAARRGQATFAYVFDPADIDGVDPGHSGELPLVFGTAPNLSAEGAKLSQRMMNAWGAFARDGRPSSESEWHVAQHGIFHWGRDPGMLRASDPELRAQLTTAGASCDRI